MCKHRGVPVFHVSYFPDWTGCLSGTSLSDDPDDKAYRKKRALLPPYKPLTLREARDAGDGSSGIFGETRTIILSESGGMADDDGDDEEDDADGGDGNDKMEVLGILSKTPSGMYKVRYAAPPGEPQPPDGWVPPDGVTAEQVKAYERKVSVRKRKVSNRDRDRLISKRASEIRARAERPDSSDSED